MCTIPGLLGDSAALGIPNILQKNAPGWKCDTLLIKNCPSSIVPLAFWGGSFGVLFGLGWDFGLGFFGCFSCLFWSWVFFLFCGGGYVSFFLIGVFGWGFLVLFFGGLGSFSSVF